MPIQIDHDRRRVDVAKVAVRVIARDGIEGLTIRAVANEAGVSTKLVTHYFDNKRALLIFTYRWVVASRRKRARAPEGWTRAVLREELLDRLPIGAEKVALFRVWFAFWALAASDAELAVVQAEEALAGMESWCERYQEVFDLDRPAAERMAWRTVTLIYGLATQLAFDFGARLMPEAVLAELVEQTLEIMLPSELPLRRSP